jgi:hypothetical protein
MTTYEEFQAKLKSIFDIPEDSDEINLSFKLDSASEAKLLKTKLNIFQKELRLLKREINLEISNIRSKYSTERSNIGTDFWSTFARTRGTIKANSMKKASLKEEELSEIEPYKGLIRLIDDNMIALDKAKLQINEYLENPED